MFDAQPQHRARGDAGRLGQPAQLGGVPPDLVGTRGVHTDKFEIRSADDRPQRMLSDVAGRELDYFAHLVLSRRSVRCGRSGHARLLPHLLADRSSDLELDDLFVGAAQFAQDVVGVLGEQWRPG